MSERDNSDLVALFVYRDSKDLIETIGKIKEIKDVNRVLWSEKIFKLPSHKENIMRSFKKYWQNNNDHNNSKYRNNKNNNNNNKINNSNGNSKKKTKF